ncbi:hypothetical protein [Fredinandcohnia quinoae]|uniref:Uncharacterized protein n=1 Tax=Fredinandcohnia quinoae TaxID=2918902 RepID=A0AAW5E527_9BACI|nr:hypothetical protein [Fredinandcohnia sp. SECRCQ15]MCH1627608.1 hypothetical protein [Fredinandcohnia sp. SECRCQ15]
MKYFLFKHSGQTVLLSTELFYHFDSLNESFIITERIIIILTIGDEKMELILWMTVLSGAFIAIFADRKCKNKKS